MLNKCPNCGIDLQTTAQFCRRCGYKVSAPLVSPSAAEATTRNLPNIPMTDPRQTGGFGTSQLGAGQGPVAYPQPPTPQLSYTPMAVGPRRTGGAKAVIFFLVLTVVVGFCLVLIGSTAFLRSHKSKISHGVVVGGGGSTTMQKSFTLVPDAEISFGNISGKIDVRPTDGNTLEFKATKSDGFGSSADDVLDISSSDKSFSVKLRDGVHASVDYEVRVPRKFGQLRLENVSGEIAVDNTEGKIEAKSVSGQINFIDVGGSTDVENVSGRTSVRFKSAPTGDLNFESVSGSVNLSFVTPPDLRVGFSSITGRIDSDYPIDKSSGPGTSSAHGVIGKGLYDLKIQTVSGAAKLNNRN